MQPPPSLGEFQKLVHAQPTGKRSRHKRSFYAAVRGHVDTDAACHVKLHTHVIAGHPARDIVDLAQDLKAELLVIGATGHSARYERLIGSRADRIVQLAHCPVLVVK